MMAGYCYEACPTNRANDPVFPSDKPYKALAASRSWFLTMTDSAHWVVFLRDNRAVRYLRKAPGFEMSLRPLPVRP
jgi:hypothetical protein